MIFSAFERLVAFRYLRPRRQEGFVSVIAGFSFLGIALGVATLIVVMAVMNGFRDDILTRILGVNGHITIRSESGTIEGYGQLVERLAELPGVVRVIPQIHREVMVSDGSGALGAQIRGIGLEDLKSRRLVSDKVVLGRIGDLARGDQVLMGIRMRQPLGASLGGQINLMLPRKSSGTLSVAPRVKAVKVAGFFQTDMAEYDATLVYMPLATAQSIFRLQGQVNVIEVFVEDLEQVEQATGTIESLLGDGYEVVDWQRVNANFFTAIQVERVVMFVILTLIIVVAAFNIISGQTMLVKDKGPDIAILRTLGASRGMILRVFVLSGASIGVLGTLLGTALGIAFAAYITEIGGALQSLQIFLQTVPVVDRLAAYLDGTVRFLARLPAILDPVEVTGIAAMALCLSFLATLPPAWRAAYLDPVEALRYE